MRRIIFSLAVVLCIAAPARADIILSFAPDGNPTTFTVDIGQTITVPIFLIERNQAPFTNVLSTNGLVNGGVRIDFTQSMPFGGSVVSGQLTQPGWFYPNPPPTYPIVVNNPDGLGGRVEISGGTVGAAAMTSGSPPAVQFGSFTFQGTTIGDVMTLSTTNTHPPGYAEFVTGGLPPVNLAIQPYSNIFWALGNTNVPITYTTTITVIPEPATILGVVVPIAAVVAWRRRRRRLSEASPLTTSD